MSVGVPAGRRRRGHRRVPAGPGPVRCPRAAADVLGPVRTRRRAGTATRRFHAGAPGGHGRPDDPEPGHRGRSVVEGPPSRRSARCPARCHRHGLHPGRPGCGRVLERARPAHRDRLHRHGARQARPPALRPGGAGLGRVASSGRSSSTGWPGSRGRRDFRSAGRRGWPTWRRTSGRSSSPDGTRSSACDRPRGSRSPTRAPASCGSRAATPGCSGAAGQRSSRRTCGSCASAAGSPGMPAGP